MTKKQKNMNNKCARKQDHRLDTIIKTQTHIVKECEVCKGKFWLTRRD